MPPATPDETPHAEPRPPAEELALARRQLAVRGNMLLAPRRTDVPTDSAVSESRDDVAEAAARQRQVIELLAARLDDLNRVDGTSALHDKLVVTLDCARRTLESIEVLPAPAGERRTV